MATPSNNHHTFLYPPSKRALIMTTTLLPPKRPKLYPPPQQSSIPTGHAAIRILCYASSVSAFIGKSGSTIKQLQLDTGSKIRVDDSLLLPGSDRRVIVIVAPATPSKTLAVEDVEFGEEVSVVQEAALRVFEKVLEVIKEDKKTVTCGVLIEKSQTGLVIGKGGKTVEKLKRESGAKIRVLLGDTLPPDVSPLHYVVEIEGGVLFVKKGLLGVCGCLQQCPQENKSSKKEGEAVESTSKLTARDYNVDSPLQQTAATSAIPFMVASPSSFEDQRSPQYLTTTSSSPATLTRPSSLISRQEVVFKVLCSNDTAGGVIGRGGSVARSLEDETGATIAVGPIVSDCDERVVTITSKEDVNSRYSPAQRAVVLVFSKSADVAALKPGSKKGSSISARLLVPSDRVGCLLGKGGAVVSEMRKASGASISILGGEQVPKCASEDDGVVEITGQLVKIQEALYLVTSILRSKLFASKVTTVPESQTSSLLVSHTSLPGRVRESIYLPQSFPTSQSVVGLSTTRHNLDLLLHPHDRVRDKIPDNLHQSFVSSKLIDGLSMTRHDLARHRDRVRDPNPIDLNHYLATSHFIDGLTTTRHDFDSLRHPHRLDHSPFAEYRTSEVDIGVNPKSYVNLDRGLTPANGRIELGSASTSRPAIVTNTTVEISIPESAIDSVYGVNGRNLERIRQISGASVSVHQAPIGSTSRTVVISGTPEETQAAQSLLHAFILTG